MLTNTSWIANEIIEAVLRTQRITANSREIVLTSIGETLHKIANEELPWLDKAEDAELEDVAEYALGCAYKLSIRRQYKSGRG